MSQKQLHPATRNQHARALKIVERSLRNYLNGGTVNFGRFNRVVGEIEDYHLEKLQVAENNGFNDWSMVEMDAARKALKTVRETAHWLLDQTQPSDAQVAAYNELEEADHDDTISGFLAGTGQI